MIVLSEIVAVAGVNPRVMADIARCHLRGVILQNRVFIRHGLLPPLYKSGVKFREEPWAGKYERFDHGLAVLRRGWGDCDDLCPWRVAELQEAGDTKADTKVYWRVKRTPTGENWDFHVEVRKGDGSVEDPSRYLGM